LQPHEALLFRGHEAQKEDLDLRCRSIIKDVYQYNKTDILTFDGHGRTIYLLYKNFIEFTKKLPTDEQWKMPRIHIAEIDRNSDNWHRMFFPRDVQLLPIGNVFSNIAGKSEEELKIFLNSFIVYFNFTGIGKSMKPLLHFMNNAINLFGDDREKNFVPCIYLSFMAGMGIHGSENWRKFASDYIIPYFEHVSRRANFTTFKLSYPKLLITALDNRFITNEFFREKVSNRELFNLINSFIVDVCDGYWRILENLNPGRQTPEEVRIQTRLNKEAISKLSSVALMTKSKFQTLNNFLVYIGQIYNE